MSPVTRPATEARGTRSVPWSWPLAGVAVLTLAAFLARLHGMGQSVFGDEVLLLARVENQSLTGMLDQVHDLESTPPFHFLLAWAGTKVADPVTGIRLPSLVLGTATVPLVYVAGARLVGRGAGLVAAFIVALSPFAVFYGTEGRAYATLAFLVAASLVLLSKAVDTGRAGWWAGWAVTCCLVLYTHYTGVYVLVAEAGWALIRHPERRRQLLLAGGAAVLAYLPWLPSLVFQSDDNASNRIDLFAPLSTESFFRDWLKSVVGHPFVPLRDLPGRLAAAVLCILFAASLAVALVRARRGRAELGEGSALLIAVALATPVGLLLYSLASKSIVLPRNMIASLPAMALVIGWALTATGRRVAPAVAAVALAALSVGTVKVLDEDNRRPPFDQVAAFIDERARPGDAVIDFFYNPMSTMVGRDLSVNLEGDYRLFRAGDDAGAWRGAENGRRRVFLVVPQLGELRGTPRRSGPGNRFPLRAHRIYRGFIPLGVFEYKL